MHPAKRFAGGSVSSQPCAKAARGLSGSLDQSGKAVSFAASVGDRQSGEITTSTVSNRFKRPIFKGGRWINSKNKKKTGARSWSRNFALWKC